MEYYIVLFECYTFILKIIFFTESTNSNKNFSTSVSTNLHGEGWSEEGPLENAGGEHDLVVGLRVVGIGVHRHHMPTTKGENSYR